ncbi:hypothetical protein AAE478_008049 [Parahypoxylon ruwenzoriense]
MPRLPRPAISRAAVQCRIIGDPAGRAFHSISFDRRAGISGGHEREVYHPEGRSRTPAFTATRALALTSQLLLPTPQVRTWVFISPRFDRQGGRNYEDNKYCSPAKISWAAY